MTGALSPENRELVERITGRSREVYTAKAEEVAGWLLEARNEGYLAAKNEDTRR